MRIFYTEYPTTKFMASDDDEALDRTNAAVVYRESDSENGTPFVILRNENRGGFGNIKFAYVNLML